MDQSSTGELFVPVVLGSIRKGRRSEAPARLIVERIRALGQRSELVDLAEFRFPLYDEEEATLSDPAVGRFRAIMARSDASVWLTPEYNHAYTAAIKNAVDYLRPELRRKPVAVCGLSGGLIGGARAVEQFKLVLIEMHAVPIRDSVYFGDAGRLFDAEGNLQRPEVQARVDEVLAELFWYARALDWGRRNVPIPEKRR